jgi:hypothetical protein
MRRVEEARAIQEKNKMTDVELLQIYTPCGFKRLRHGEEKAAE